MGGEAESANLPSGQIELLLTRALDGVRMEKDILPGTNFPDFPHRLPHAGLVVRAHDGDKRGVGPEGMGEMCRINQAIVADIEIGDLESPASFQQMKGVQDGVMFRSHGDEVASPPRLRLRQTLHGEIAALGSTTGENNFRRLALQAVGDGNRGRDRFPPERAAPRHEDSKDCREDQKAGGSMTARTRGSSMVVALSSR